MSTRGVCDRVSYTAQGHMSHMRERAVGLATTGLNTHRGVDLVVEIRLTIDLTLALFSVCGLCKCILQSKIARCFLRNCAEVTANGCRLRNSYVADCPI
jgi:hypothetical protein